MIDHIFFTGLIGSLILVTGAAWPENPKVHPAASIKNWLFGIGGFFMLGYSIMNYLEGGPVFFIFLQALVAVSTILMMLNVRDSIDVPVISISAIALTIWSLYLFEGYNTIFFIIGLSGIGLGYAFDMGTLRRGLSLTIGSVLIAIFSYIEASWIFFWLNVFFALFAGYYVVRDLLKKSSSRSSK
jgi:hypothetical protein